MSAGCVVITSFICLLTILASIGFGLGYNHRFLQYHDASIDDTHGGYNSRRRAGEAASRRGSDVKKRGKASEWLFGGRGDPLAAVLGTSVSPEEALELLRRLAITNSTSARTLNKLNSLKTFD